MKPLPHEIEEVMEKYIKSQFIDILYIDEKGVKEDEDNRE